MLAQNFKTPAELGLTDRARAALVTVLGMMERGELTHVSYKCGNVGEEFDIPKFTGHFNMVSTYSKAGCGTIACIQGTAIMISGDETLFDGVFGYNNNLSELFVPAVSLASWFSIDNITVEQAARALRAYLTTGRADWS